jgi:uncharacterized protein YndB with AHSA1/START domain
VASQLRIQCRTARIPEGYRESCSVVPGLPGFLGFPQRADNRHPSRRIANAGREREVGSFWGGVRWWTPKSFGVSFLSCEADVRTGGTYRFVFSHPSSEQPMPFFGRYVEVTPPSRLVWTNDEGDENGAVTTVTFDEGGGETLVVMHDLYPSKKALDDAIASGSTSGSGEQFEQLDELLVTLEASVRRS